MNRENESIPKACRRIARQIWREQPTLTLDEMLGRHEIKDLACQGILYDPSKLKNWVMPDLTPQDELERLRELPIWKIEEAIALWLDFNPFILLQAIENPHSAFWNGAFHPNLRENFYLLLEKAKRSVSCGQLNVIQNNEKFLVLPKDFYEWGVKNTDGPNGFRPQRFFAELQGIWSASTDETKRETKVGEKIREIVRILDAITAADPEFERSSMPGRKEDFQVLCEQLNKKLFSVAHATFNDYLSGICTFNPGARKTDYYTKISHKLG